MNKKRFDKAKLLKDLENYITELYGSEDDIPTLTGLAVYLGISKDELSRLERASDKEIRRAYIKAKNRIEHYFISRSALKKISSTTAHFYLNSMFGYNEPPELKDDDYEIKVSVAGD